MALVSNRDGWVFVHIPKNGGLAVYNFLRHHLSGEDDVVVMEESVRQEGLPDEIQKHSSAIILRNWLGEAWERYTTFAVVRDPLARAQSVFEEIRAVPPVLREHEPYWSVAGPGWWAAIDAMGDVNDFIASGLLDPDGPVPVTHTQHSYVYDGDELIVDHLFSMDGMTKGIPELLHYRGEVAPAHVRDYERTPLTMTSLDFLHEKFAADFVLAGRVL